MFTALDSFNMLLPVFIKIMAQPLYLYTPRNNIQGMAFSFSVGLNIYCLQGNVANTNGLTNMHC